MTNSIRWRGILNARHQSKNGPAVPTEMCLSNVEAAYGVPHWYASAALAWKGATKKHLVKNYKDIPTGVPCYWTGGSGGYGHIAISARRGTIRIWSTDIRRWGYWDRVPITEIEKKWGLKFEGWSEDLAGETIYTPPLSHPKLRTTRVSKAIDNVQLAVHLLGDAVRKGHRKRRVMKFKSDLHNVLEAAKEHNLER